MHKDWTTELQERISKHLTRVSEKGGAAGTLDTALHRITADVEVYGVLMRREGFAKGFNTNAIGEPASESYQTESPAMTNRFYPLPTRTKRVLREEPIPGGDVSMLYRWSHTGLEIKYAGHDFNWSRIHPGAGAIELMRHAVDLHDNPYTVVEETADEDNPWPEMEP